MTSIDPRGTAGPGQPPARDRSDLADLAELADLAAVLETAVQSRDLGPFWAAFRATSLPYIGAAHERDPAGLFRRLFPILHRLGAISPAVALAVENHYYVSSAVATFPSQGDLALDGRRRELAGAIFAERRLVANTNSKVHGRKLGEMGTLAVRERGGFRISGKAAYTSMASQGDLLVFITAVEGEGPAVFVAPAMQGNPAIQIGPYLFPSAMIDSDTRQITFHDLWLPGECLIAGGPGGSADALFAFEMAWHQVLIPTLYLGAAARGIEEARLFLRGTRGRDERPLAELDGMVVDVGRLAIDYRSARAMVAQAGEALGGVKSLPADAAALERAVDLAGAAKYTATRCAERLVDAARRIVGARCFAGGHPLERLTDEVIFGTLGPEVSAVIERRHGQRALGERSFLQQD